MNRILMGGLIAICLFAFNVPESKAKQIQEQTVGLWKKLSLTWRKLMGNTSRSEDSQ